MLAGFAVIAVGYYYLAGSRTFSGPAVAETAKGVEQIRKNDKEDEVKTSVVPV